MAHLILKSVMTVALMSTAVGCTMYGPYDRGYSGYQTYDGRAYPPGHGPYYRRGYAGYQTPDGRNYAGRQIPINRGYAGQQIPNAGPGPNYRGYVAPQTSNVGQQQVVVTPNATAKKPSLIQMYKKKYGRDRANYSASASPSTPTSSQSQANQPQGSSNYQSGQTSN